MNRPVHNTMYMYVHTLLYEAEAAKVFQVFVVVAHSSLWNKYVRAEEQTAKTWRADNEKEKERRTDGKGGASKANDYLVSESVRSSTHWNKS